MPYPYRYPNIPKPDSYKCDAPAPREWVSTSAPSLESRVTRMIDLLEELAESSKKAESKVIIIPDEKEIERYG